MKVASILGSGSKTRTLVVTGIAVAIAMLAGAGFVPVRAALAQVDAPGMGEDPAEALVLPPAEGQKTADHIRQPSELGVVDAQLTGTRTPTVVRRVVRTAVAPASGATAAPAGGGWKSAKVSWYGPGFHGRRTANGEIFDTHELTMAHRSLPMGANVRVTNLENGRTLVLRVNDRGPYVRGRVADLSHAAAERLGFVDDGVVPARIELL